MAENVHTVGRVFENIMWFAQDSKVIEALDLDEFYGRFQNLRSKGR